MKTCIIRKPIDSHVHLREGNMLRDVISFTARHFSAAVVMPNLIGDRVTTAQHLKEYYGEIISAATASGCPSFTPLMSFKLTSAICPDDIPDLKRAGALIGKYYPPNVTTGSSQGVGDIEALFPVFEAMRDAELSLSMHCELPGADKMSAEQEFIPTLELVIHNFPKLRIVVEHVSSQRMVGFLTNSSLPSTVAATITAHHLVLTYLRDVIRNPHNFCKPVAKSQMDCDAVVRAALSGDPRFFFGSDSAPHWPTAKQGNPPAAGIFSAPVALPIVTQIFSEADRLNLLECFISRFGSEFYRQSESEERLSLIENPWTVSGNCGGVVPFYAGEELNWQIES